MNNITRVSLTAMMAGLSACVSVLPEPEGPKAVYSLSFSADLTDRAPLAGIVVVREPDGTRMMAGRNMVFEGDNGALSVLGRVQWADSSTLMLQRALIDALNAGEGQGIAVSPDAGTRGDIEVSWRVVSLAVRKDDAHAVLTLTLLDGRDRAPLAQKTFEASRPVSARKEEVSALIASADAVVAEAADYIRAFLQERAS